jgi:superfamily II DNA or RNA helicase
MSTLKEATTFLKAYELERGSEAMVNIAPVALAVRMVPGYDPHDERSLYEPSVLVYPVAHPVLAAYMTRDGATQVGSMSWVAGMNEERPNRRAVADMVAHVAPGCLVPYNWVATPKGARDLSQVTTGTYYWNRDSGLRNFLGRPNRIGVLFGDAAERHGEAAHLYRSGSEIHRERGYGVVGFSVSDRAVFFRVYTNKLIIPSELEEEIGEIDLNLRPGGRSSRTIPKPIRAAHAAAIVEWATSVGLEIVDVDGSQAIPVLRKLLSRRVVAWTRPGRPAQAQISVGTRVTSDELYASNREYTTPVSTREVATASRIRYASSEEVGRWLAEGLPMSVHDSVADTARLAMATPVESELLRPFQRAAVGRHLATKVGYANVSVPGSGKTVMSLDAMRRRSEHIENYRGLVVAEANVRQQFADEAGPWFSEAQVVVVEKHRDAAALESALLGSGPVVVVTSYALASTVAEFVRTLDVEAALSDLFGEVKVDAETAEALVAGGVRPVRRSEVVVAASEEEVSAPEPGATLALGEVLLSVHWHDIIADEAASLRNRSSRQSKSLWALRSNSDVAVALTGTPISRSVDDLGEIIAWVRNDKHLFYGKKLSTEFDLSDDEDLEQFAQAVGPVMIRYDQSEYADELPSIAEPEVIRITPTPAEARLATAARDELKRVYEELVAWMGASESVDHSSPEYAEISAALATARSAWMGGTQLARMAASDPASLLTSTSAGAALLEAQGLIAAATETTGTKRLRVVSECVDRVGRGERILVFTEFASVARGLISDLRGAGLRVGEILGGGGKKRDVFVKEFANGNLDVMVSTSAGERGLNLQSATTLIHVDLPWSADQVTQRHGRVERIGSSATELKIVFMIAEGTIEERIAAIVASRSIESMRALDASRGVKVKDTSVARTMGGLINSADITLVSGREASMLAMTRILLAS